MNKFITENLKIKSPEENAINIFKNEWNSRFPEPFQNLTGGNSDLFDDTRIQWAINKFNGVKDKSILELGPLEGGHSYQISKAGAKSTLGIESNTNSFLKCLITKEIFNLQNCSFIHADCVDFLKNNSNQYDAIFACGILYHMINPLELIHLLSLKTNNLYLWTHFYDEKLTPLCKNAKNFNEKVLSSYNNYQATFYKHEYLEELNYDGFCGGIYNHSYYLNRLDIINSLKYFGFTQIDIHFESNDDINGPHFSLIAKK
jgi:hypothetical protein